MATDLSRREFLRTGSQVAAGAAALATLPAVFSGEAEAAATVIDGVPHYDYTNLEREDVLAAGAILSDNAIAIVSYGNTRAVEDAAQRAAVALRAQSWPVGIIHADSQAGTDDPVQMEIFVNGQSMAWTDSAPTDHLDIQNQVVQSFQTYQTGAEQVSELNSDND